MKESGSRFCQSKMGLKRAKSCFFIEIVCLSVHILGLERDMVNARSLDPNLFVNRLKDLSRKFKDVFLQCPSWVPENGQNRHFCRNFCIEIVCLCVHILSLGCVKLGVDALTRKVSLKKNLGS